jgi:hypothetical protein
LGNGAHAILDFGTQHFNCPHRRGGIRCAEPFKGLRGGFLGSRQFQQRERYRERTIAAPSLVLAKVLNVLTHSLTPSCRRESINAAAENLDLTDRGL